MTSVNPAPVPFFDPRRLLEPHRPALRQAFDRVLDHGVFILGNEVQQFEASLASALGAAGAVGVSSGTDALLASFHALGLPAGGEILCTPFTFVASASSILRVGLRPVLVDLPAQGFHPTPEAFEAAWGPQTVGILVVHLFGEPIDCAPLLELCARRGGVLVEDCAQAIGARTRAGRSVGLDGRTGTFSFFPAKNLGTLGDGGAVISDDRELLGVVTQVRQHGRVARDRFDRLGGNFRLDALQAAMLQVLLPALEGWIAARRRNAERYLTAFAPLAASGALVLPTDVPGHGWNQFVVRTPRRDALAAALQAEGVGTAIYYAVPLHRCRALEAASLPVSMPNVERACDEVLALPVYPGLGDDEHERVVQVVQAAIAC